VEDFCLTPVITACLFFMPSVVYVGDASVLSVVSKFMAVLGHERLEVTGML
jgi:hypothetical protein